MGELIKKKSRRLRGIELVVTGGATMFLSNIVGWLAPATLCVYGLYRLILRKSYKDGMISTAAGILLLTLLRGPLSGLMTVSMAAGGVLLGLGAILMILPKKKDDGDDVIVKPEKVEDY
jgi:hypothetical protein